MADFSAAPLVAAGPWTVTPAAARAAALTIAEGAPDVLEMILSMCGLAGQDGPEDGRWSNYAFGRPQKTEGA